MKTADDHIARARDLLARGRPELAESALSDAIDAAEVAQELAPLTRARLALGELLFEQERHDEALPFLQAVVRTEMEDGSVDREVKRAAEVLRALHGWSA